MEISVWSLEFEIQIWELSIIGTDPQVQISNSENKVFLF